MFRKSFFSVLTFPRTCSTNLNLAVSPASDRQLRLTVTNVDARTLNAALGKQIPLAFSEDFSCLDNQPADSSNPTILFLPQSRRSNLLVLCMFPFGYIFQPIKSIPNQLYHHFQVHLILFSLVDYCL